MPDKMNVIEVPFENPIFFQSEYEILGIFYIISSGSCLSNE